MNNEYVLQGEVFFVRDHNPKSPNSPICDEKRNQI